MNKTMVPFVKWVGGKRQLLPEIRKRIPQTFNTFYEPFVGGGAVFLNLLNQKTVINDLNSDLINVYRVIKNQNKLQHLKTILPFFEYLHQELDSKDFYYAIRKFNCACESDANGLNRSSNVLQAARLIYLNKAGFNGLYRVNAKKSFNVPFGKKEKVKTFDEENLDKVAYFLRSNRVRIWNRPFQSAMQQAQKGDFVYLDPPYDYENNKGFHQYQKDGFGKKEQILLQKECLKLAKRQVKFMLSNHNTSLIRELYQEFKIEIISAKRLVGGKGASRSDVKEVLIRNYEERERERERVKNKGTGAGGAKTTQMGHDFENATNFEKWIELKGYTLKLDSLKSNHTKSPLFQIYCQKDLKGFYGRQHSIKQAVKKHSYEDVVQKINWFIPDAFIISNIFRKITIFEMKNQNCAGSVSEKIQTGLFKLFCYQKKLFKNSQFQNYDVHFEYILSKYFGDNEGETKLKEVKEFYSQYSQQKIKIWIHDVDLNTLYENLHQYIG